MAHKFCNSLFRYSRRQTLPVNIGTLTIGFGRRIAVQSMCTTKTTDTEASLAQTLRIVEAGGDIVRLTAQGRAEVEGLRLLKERLYENRCMVPIVADIHFNANIADEAAQWVDKVRINPGNYIDKKGAGAPHIYTEKEYTEEKERLKERFLKFLDICKKNNRSIRIGVNHGSLSDRLMSRYGDTPEGMVASAMEFLEICAAENFNNVVVSMKSSNTQTMVRAYRMLVAAMSEAGMSYPLHLGVTEAGEGEDGRIKSAVGIGALLGDGLGDTLRVSLTEEPENEIPIGKELVAHFAKLNSHNDIDATDTKHYHPYSYHRRETVAVGNIGGNNPPIVIVSENSEIQKGGELMPDYIFSKVSNSKNYISPSDISLGCVDNRCRFSQLSIKELTPEVILQLKNNPQIVVIAISTNTNNTAELRSFSLTLSNHGLTNPIIARRTYNCNSSNSLALESAADNGVLFIDGLFDGIWIENIGDGVLPDDIVSISFSILQSSGVRYSKTEYVSCPGCGRTQFALGETLRRVKEATSALKGLKIAVMGCIVNGPGEMADADYGYVGSGAGLITLYKGREVVKRNISEADAIDELLKLIKSNTEF